MKSMLFAVVSGWKRSMFRAVCLFGLLVGVGANAWGALPNGYETVEAVSANGGQYIDTGIACREGLTAEVTFVYAQDPTKSVLGADEVVLPVPKDAAINRAYHVTSPMSSNVGSQRTLYLFARNDNGVAVDFAKARIAAAKLTEGDVVLRDFVPCRETASGKYGFYDQVQGRFYASDGEKGFFVPWRVGVYGGLGGTGSVFELFRLVDRSPELELVNVSSEMAREGSVFGRIDAVVMPGGSSKNEMTSLGDKGQANLIAFIRNGGAYYGTCAGSHLVLEDELNISGYKRVSYNENEAMVDIALNEEGLLGLDTEQSVWKMRYHQGPFITNGTAVAGADLKVWGAYANTSLVSASGGHPMAGKYAVLAGTYYDGKMLVVASHPESAVANYPFIRQAWRWLSGRDDITVESQQMGGYVGGRTNVYYCGTYANGISPLVEAMLKIDDDPRLLLAAAGDSTFKTGKYLQTARAFIADTGKNAAVYHRGNYQAVMNALKTQGGLVLIEDDGLSADDIWKTIDALANDRRTETSCTWNEARTQTFAGNLTMTGLDLRVESDGSWTSVFSDGEIAFAPDANGLGGDWVYCAATALHRVIVSNACVTAVHGNHRRNSFCTATSGGTYSPVASNRLEVTLGARNVSNGVAALAFSKGFVVANFSTLSIDAREKGEGRYKILEAGDLTVKGSTFLSEAEVKVGAGKSYALEQDGNAIVLTISKPAEEATLPKEYEKVGYVQSTGTQFVDTGILMQDQITLDVDFAWATGLSDYAVIFGAYANINSTEYRLYMGSVSSKGQWRAVTEKSAFSEGGVSGMANVMPGIRTHLVQTVNGSKVSFTVNGETYSKTCSSAQKAHPVNCYLFGHRTSSERLKGAASIKLYAAKIYTNSVLSTKRVLARDYRPCREKATGILGLYDTVKGEFQPSAGAEPFLGPIGRKGYQELDYIESTGAQYVDTGIMMQDRLTIDVGWKWTGWAETITCMFGSYAKFSGTAYRNYFVYVNQSRQWRGAVEANGLATVLGGTAATNVDYRAVVKVDGKKMHMAVNNSMKTNTFSTAQTSHAQSNYLFALHENDGFIDGSPAKFYTAQIYTNSIEVGSRVLARDYRPCYHEKTKTYGLYDCVTKTYSVSGGEPFTGPEVVLPKTVAWAIFVK